ncbi:hypothetical protein [Roseivivax jejudonensis]|nr:hypothetical protein [Roseivivax jejudonensis]
MQESGAESSQDRTKEPSGIRPRNFEELARLTARRKRLEQAAQGAALGKVRPQARPPRADMSFTGRLKDNIVGVDDGVQSFGEKAATALNIGGESLTLGLVGDEAAAATDAAMGRGSYDERLQVRRDQEQQLRDENPGVAFAAEVAPALIPGAGGAKLAAKASNALGRSGAGMALGAGAGGLYGFLEGEGDASARAQSGALTGALGGIFGTVAPKAVDALSGVPTRVRMAFKQSQQRPTLGALRTTKDLAYRAVDEAGESFGSGEMRSLYERATRAFEAANYVEEVDNAGRAVLRTLEKRADQPNTTLSQLDGIRQSLWRRYSSAPDQPFILDAIREIDALIDSRAGASEVMGLARAANARYAKSQLLDDAFRKAEDQTASTGSGGNILNKYRQAVTSIINDKKKARFFSEDEISLMRQFVRGSRSENFARLLGKLSPDGNGLMLALHTTGGILSGGATLPAMVVGSAAKGYADKAVRQGVEAIRDAASGFRPASESPQLTRSQAAMITGATPALER